MSSHAVHSKYMNTLGMLLRGIYWAKVLTIFV